MAAAAAGKAAGKANEAAGGRAAGQPRVHARQIAWLTVIILLFLLGVSGSVILWQTRLWDDYIDSQITIRNDTPAYQKWAKSEVTSLLRYWIFNYTNVAEFMAGDDAKLRVQDVGPYTFREITHRVNDVFHPNGTVSYNEERDYQFLPELSNGKMSDNISSLHLLFIGMNYVARRYSYLERLPLWSFVNLMRPKAIVTRTAHEWFWGYSDAVKAFVELKQGKIKAGIIQSANGTSPDTMTVFTGVDDVSRLGEITRFNGLELMDFYSTKECNRVDGSDGARFPPPAVKPGATLHIYHREACRRVPIVYEKDVTVWDDIPARRFRAPKNLFDNGNDSPENQCYCKDTHYDRCFPSGVINTEHCREGAPFFVSYPHFLFGDESYRNDIEGLNPDEERHYMHIDIHQRIGATVAIKSRFQLNALMSNFFDEPFMMKVNGRILPYLWIEREMEEWPEDLRASFRLMSFTAPAAHSVLRWGCPLLALATGLVLLVCLYVEVAALLRPGPYTPDMQMTRL
ncbi:hypothetical protein R5R35_014361 [Gryllus longicercus]